MQRTKSIFVVLISLMAFIPSQAQAKDTSDVDTIKQIAQDMGDAMVAGDIDKLDRIFADNWASIGFSGKVTTKEALLKDFKSFHDKLEWFENGPTDVQVFHNVAVSCGSVKEKRSQDGKDTSGQFAWMDLLEKRAGKWVVVRSAGARLSSADAAKTQSQDPAIVESIKHLQQAVGDAMVTVDIDKLSQSYADDWVTVDSAGRLFTKDRLLDDFKSGKHKLVSFEIGPMDVQVLGNVSLVEASVTEKRIQDGKDISGQFVFVDLLENRAGKWVIVRSLGARVKDL